MTKFDAFFYFATLLTCASLLSYYIFAFRRYPSDVQGRPLVRRMRGGVSDVFVSGPRSAPCRSDAECPEERACHLGACVSKLAKGEGCDPNTGAWTPVAHEGETRIACVCLRPELATQRFVGANCDVDATCGPGGRLRRKPLGDGLHAAAECECPPGSAFHRDPSNGRPSCRPEKALVRAAAREEKVTDSLRCRSDEDEVDASSRNPYFGSDLYDRIRPMRCVKRPCSYDALTGRPLKRTRFVPGWGCACDPRSGNLGVRLEDAPGRRVLADDVPGYNACVNIFRDGELVGGREAPNVKLYTYFYVHDASPVSFVQWSGLDSESLAEPFRRATNSDGYGAAAGAAAKNVRLQIEETWPHDYAQFVLRDPDAFLVRVPADTCREPNLKAVNLFRVRYFFCGEYITTHYAMPDCRNLPRDRSGRGATRNLLRYPLCYVHERDVQSTDAYDGRVVTNPLYVADRSALLARLPAGHDAGSLSNGFELGPRSDDGDLWEVRAAPFDPSLVEENAFEHVVPRFHSS